MPPRISRLKWPRLFPRYEPVPFAHPKLYIVRHISTAPSTPDQPKPPNYEQDEVDRAGQTAEKQYARKRGLHRVERSNRMREGRQQRDISRHSAAFNSQDWRTPFSLLRQHTPQDLRYHVKQTERLDMPAGMSGFYPGGLSRLFVEVFLHTGCHVQKARGDETGNDSFLALELSGTGLSIDLARKMLDNSILVKSEDHVLDKGNMKDHSPTITSLAPNKSMPRAVWSEILDPRPRSIDQVRPPPVWTTITFANYVQDLINSHPPARRNQSKEHTLDSNNARPLDIVTGKLISLFSNPTSVSSASAFACVLAMQFLFEKRKIPEVRKIFELLERRVAAFPGLKRIFAIPAIFNVCLRAAAHDQDLHNYNFLLRMMLDRKSTPDHVTWAALLSLVQARFPRDAKHIISAMRTRNALASPAAKIAIANVTVRSDFEKWIKQGGNMYDFLDHYNRQWGGEEWLDVRATNMMLQELLARGCFDDGKALLDILIKNRNHQPNIHTLSVFLGAAAAHSHLGLAQYGLEQTLGRVKRLVPNKTTYDKLAHLATMKRAHNVLRVAWRYACMSKQVTFQFKKLMENNIALDLIPGMGAQSKLSRGDMFRATAAKIAVGIDQSYAVEDFEVKADSKTKRQPLYHDFKVADSYSPAESLLEAMTAAVKKDEEWGSSGLRKSVDLKTQLSDAVEVKVIKKSEIAEQKMISRFEKVETKQPPDEEVDEKMHPEHAWLERMSMGYWSP